MFVIIGIAVVIIAVIGGFMFAGGNVLLLIQPAEFIIIVGAAVGSMLISSPPNLLKKIVSSFPLLIKGFKIAKQDYLELLKALNDLFLLAQRDGLLAIEKHIENPKESEILSQAKNFVNNHHVITFFSDTMKVMLSGGVPPHELETLIDAEIETFEMEGKPVTATISKVGDAFPGLGIVAAVLGIIVTMSSIDKGPEYVGLHVAAALVGTFLGVLLSYGFVGPMATNLELIHESEKRYLETIKACIVAYAKGNPPIVSVEFARRTIFSDYRPSFSELENFIRGKGEVSSERK
jgi:chemotaxis protein MotA